MVDRWAARRVQIWRPLMLEALLVLLTIVVGVVGVTLLVYAPRALFSTQFGPAASFERYVEGVQTYLSGLLQGELGGSNRGRSFNRNLLTAGRRSLELLVVTLLVALPLGLAWAGLLSTIRRRLPLLLLFGFGTIVIALPSFVTLLLLIEAIVTLGQRTGLRIGAVYGYGLDHHLIIPVTVLALRGAAFIAGALHVAQEDILRQDWVRAARARGLGGLTLWRRHIFPALRVPILAGTLGMLRVIVSGMIIVEYVYNWGGLGTKLIRGGELGRPRPADEGVAAGAGVLLVLFFVLIDAFGRTVQRWADARLRTESSHG